MCVIAVHEPHVDRAADESTHPDVAAWAYVGALQHGLLALPSIGSIEMPHLVDSYDYMGIAHIAETPGEPARLTECVYRVAEARDRRPIIIAANGIATDDEDARDEYLRGVAAQLRLLREDRVDVVGYFHHSGIDGYEWSDGFARPRGLIGRTRAIKPAGEFLQQFLR
jgi:hypothetical protein